MILCILAVELVILPEFPAILAWGFGGIADAGGVAWVGKFFHNAAWGASIIELYFLDIEFCSCVWALSINLFRALVACSRS